MNALEKATDFACLVKLITVTFTPPAENVSRLTFVQVKNRALKMTRAVFVSVKSQNSFV